MALLPGLIGRQHRIRGRIIRAMLRARQCSFFNQKIVHEELTPYIVDGQPFREEQLLPLLACIAAEGMDQSFCLPEEAGIVLGVPVMASFRYHMSPKDSKPLSRGKIHA